MTVTTILLIIALICFFIAAIPLPWQNPISVGWLGMFFFVLTFLFGR